MPTTLWEFTIDLCLAGGNASATCLKVLAMHFADVPTCAFEFAIMFKAQYKCQVIIIITS